MKQIAIVGGGISGVAAAYELALAQQQGEAVEFVLFEATDRLGGIVETQHRDGFVVECGPDSWVTEKPWARELAVELGLESEIIASNDRWRRTYIVRGRQLVPMPDGMRMMVPTNWAAVLDSPLFSWQARLAYLREPRRAAELKAAALASGQDESVASFLRNHFGEEVTRTLGGPLLAGVFGGDVEQLSARAVMPAFVKMEREHGSLIFGLAEKRRESRNTDASVFTTLSSGLGTLIDRMTRIIPADSIRLSQPVKSLAHEQERWVVRTSAGEARFDSLVLATPADVTSKLLYRFDSSLSELLAMDASSAIVVALAFSSPQTAGMRIPRGFGYLVPQGDLQKSRETDATPLLACTFVDQKFPQRVPEGGILLRAFFGGEAAVQLLSSSEDHLATLAHEQLCRVLGRLPSPAFSIVRRWPRSLPQYAVGHLERVAEIEGKVSALPGLHVIGNAYHGVGLPDLIREGRSVSRKIVSAK